MAFEQQRDYILDTMAKQDGVRPPGVSKGQWYKRQSDQANKAENEIMNKAPRDCYASAAMGTWNGTLLLDEEEFMSFCDDNEITESNYHLVSELNCVQILFSPLLVFSSSLNLSFSSVSLSRIILLS